MPESLSFPDFSNFAFWGNNPNVNQQLRQRIALSMLSQKKGFPKTLGEGLTAIGDSIGDIGIMRRLEQADLAAQAVQPPGAPSASPTGYAPPSDVSEAPAVRAINAAAPTEDTPAEPASAPNPASGLGARDRIASMPGVSDGGYNFIDAQAGNRFKPTPGYMQDAIAAREPNPDMQAYYGSLSGSEAKNAQDVSPTGAAGPYQFTRGTGAQYGVPGNARLDPGASTDAVRDLTADNAATFARINGRQPTFQDLALMHQQGGTTGARMAAGTGNAPPNNLAVNNIPPGATPQAAVAKINRFYGMPNEPAPVRDAVASTMVAQQPDQRLALASPRGVATDAPQPAPSGIQKAPVQVAQAQQNYPAGFVPPPIADPTGAPIAKMSPYEATLRQWVASETAKGNIYAAPKVATQLQAMENERTIRQNEANEMFKAKLSRGTENDKLRTQAQIDQAKRIADEAHVRAQTRKEGIVESPEDKYIMGPDGVVRPIRVEGEDPNAMPSGKLTEDQRKTLVYHGWAKTGNQAITGNDQLLAHGLSQEALGKLPIFGNAAQNAEYRRAKNGADNFILAFMRSTSGAQYGATERLDHAKAMLPRLGDDAKTLADKANQRQQFVDSEYAGLGRQGQKMADFLERKHDPAGAERKQQLIDIELQGIKGSQVGEVKTNRKTGAQVMWNGTRWVGTQ